MENLKFRVHSPEHSEAIQKRLFELGYSWRHGGKEIENINQPFLLCDKSGYISYAYITQKGVYDRSISKEATLDYLYNIEQPIKVELNDEYTAKVFKDKVVLECQDLTHDAIKKLYKAVKEAKK